jgi:hypothetical protein
MADPTDREGDCPIYQIPGPPDGSGARNSERSEDLVNDD